MKITNLRLPVHQSLYMYIRVSNNAPKKSMTVLKIQINILNYYLSVHIFCQVDSRVGCVHYIAYVH